MVEPLGVDDPATKLSAGLIVGGLLTSGDAETKLGSEEGVRVNVEVILRARLRPLGAASAICIPKSLSSAALTLMMILFLNSSGEGRVTESFIKGSRIMMPSQCFFISSTMELTCPLMERLYLCLHLQLFGPTPTMLLPVVLGRERLSLLR